MISVGNVIKIIRPSYNFSVIGNTYEGIDWNGNEPVTYEEFIEAYNNYEQLIQEQEQDKQTKKDAAIQKLADLGLSVEDIRLVLE